MTTVTQFTPSPFSAFTFSPTLDGQQYTGVVTWNIAAQRWYISVYALGSTDPVFSRPLIGSTSAVDVELASWSNGWVDAVTSIPHDYVLGATVALTASGFAPDGYNGDVLAVVADEITVRWPAVNDPGIARQLGVLDAPVNLAGGYFSSTLVFREATQQFEVSP